MALCRPFGFIAYNLTEPYPHGFITRKLVKQYDFGDSPPANQLENPIAGQTFKQVPNPFDPTQIVWIEERVLLPSNSLLVEFLFRTKSTSNNITLGNLSGGSGFGLGGLGLGAGFGLGSAIANSTSLGGITNVRSRFAWHACSAETKYDIPIQITKEVLDTGKISLPNFVMGIIGVFDEPLDLTDVEKQRIGESNRRQGIKTSEEYQGTLIEGQERVIDGKQVTVSFFEKDGEKTPEQVFREKTRFEKIIYDERAFKFRADNPESPEGDVRYGPVFNFGSFNDISSKDIQIKTAGLKEKDVVYVSGTFVSKRYFRQVMDHRASLAELPNGAIGRSGSSNILPISSDVNSFNYQISDWRIRKKGDSRFDLKYYDLSQDDISEDDREWEEISGWRLSDLIGKNEGSFFAADSRGLLKVEKNGSIKVLVPRSDIQNDDGTENSWFQKLLVDNQLVDGDFSTKINDINRSGHMFNQNPLVNSFFADNEKVPYWRPLALALNSLPDPCGLPFLEFLDKKINIPASVEDQADLSNSVFVNIGNSSFMATAYNSFVCGGLGGGGSFYDPIDPLNGWSLIVPIPPGNLFTDWTISTTFFRQRFDRNTRIHVEAFLPDGATTKAFSSIYVRTNPFVQSSLSLDTFYNKDEAFAFFEDDELGSLSYYRLSDGFLQRQLARLTFDNSANHEIPDFNHDMFKNVGYNFTVGDLPSYSIGKSFSSEIGDFCKEVVKFEDLFSRIELRLSDFSAILAEDRLIKSIDLEYEIESALDIDNNISIEFEETNKVINNIYIPNEVGIHKFNINAAYYSASRIRFHGSILSSLNNLKVFVTYTSAENIKKYLVTGRQTATAIDNINRVFVFYYDEESSNISLAMSNDNANSWYKFKDLIRIEEGESADSPYVVSDKSNNIFYLFYRLDSRFLMIKKINPYLFICDDADVSYVIPDDFKEDTSDDEGLGGFSDFGKAIRTSSSYFVMGDSLEEKFKQETEQSRARVNAELLPRYEFVGSDSVMNQPFDNSVFCAYLDNKSSLNVFFISDDGSLSMLRSADYTSWAYVFQNLFIHKNFNNQDSEETDLSLTNIQSVYDDSEDTLYIMYTHSECLFVRRISHGFSYGNSSFMELNEESSKPIFIVGDISQIMSNGEIKDLAFIFPYDDIEKFDSKFIIDSTAKPVGYLTSNGIFRGLYKSNGRVFGFTLNGDQVLLDVQLRNS